MRGLWTVCQTFIGKEMCSHNNTPMVTSFFYTTQVNRSTLFDIFDFLFLQFFRFCRGISDISVLLSIEICICVHFWDMEWYRASEYAYFYFWVLLHILDFCLVEILRILRSSLHKTHGKFQYMSEVHHSGQTSAHLMWYKLWEVSQDTKTYFPFTLR